MFSDVINYIPIFSALGVCILVKTAIYRLFIKNISCNYAFLFSIVAVASSYILPYMISSSPTASNFVNSLPIIGDLLITPYFILPWIASVIAELSCAKLISRYSIKQLLLPILVGNLIAVILFWMLSTSLVTFL